MKILITLENNPNNPDTTPNDPNKSRTVNTPIKITSNAIKHRRYSFRKILIVSQLAKRQIGINKVVKIIKNKLIPSNPKKKL